MQNHKLQLPSPEAASKGARERKTPECGMKPRETWKRGIDGLCAPGWKDLRSSMVTRTQTGWSSQCEESIGMAGDAQRAASVGFLLPGQG